MRERQEEPRAAEVIGKVCCLDPERHDPPASTLGLAGAGDGLAAAVTGLQGGEAGWGIKQSRHVRNKYIFSISSRDFQAKRSMLEVCFVAILVTTQRMRRIKKIYL